MAQIDTPQTDAAWVVGVDGSDASAHASDWAACHAPGRVSRLQLVTSWQAPVTGPLPSGADTGGFGVGSPPFDRGTLVSGAQRVVDTAAERIGPVDGVTIEPVVAHGGPSAVLLDAADDADLLVVGTRGRGGFSRLLLGSTSTQCATHASGPVAVVPAASDIEAASDIVVGIDGSDNSIAALSWALSFAQPGAKVEALSVWDTSPIAVGADQFFFPEATDLAEERFHHLVDKVAASHRITGIDITRTFDNGAPRRKLAERSRSAALLVLGARGHGAIGAALIGSVSTWLLHHASTTTVIVPAASN